VSRCSSATLSLILIRFFSYFFLDCCDCWDLRFLLDLLLHVTWRVVKYVCDSQDAHALSPTHALVRCTHLHWLFDAAFVADAAMAARLSPVSNVLSVSCCSLSLLLIEERVKPCTMSSINHSRLLNSPKQERGNQQHRAQNLAHNPSVPRC
jgi:hypothetical protein